MGLSPQRMGGQVMKQRTTTCNNNGNEICNIQRRSIGDNYQIPIRSQSISSTRDKANDGRLGASQEIRGLLPL